MENSLALPDTKRYGVFLGKMVRQQQSIPQVLVISQFSRGATDIFAQFGLFLGREPGWAARMVPIQQTGESLRSKPLDPIFNGSRRIPIQTSCVIRADSIQDLKDSMEAVKVASFRCSRYLVLNGSLEYLSIGNIFPSHWEPPNSLYSQYTQLLI